MSHLASNLTDLASPPPDFATWPLAEQLAWHRKLRQLAWHYSSTAPVRLVDARNSRLAVREELYNAPPTHPHGADKRAAYLEALRRADA